MTRREVDAFIEAMRYSGAPFAFDIESFGPRPEVIFVIGRRVHIQPYETG